MARILFIIREAMAAGVFLLPVLLLLNALRFHNRARTAAYLLFTLYLSVLWALVGLPSAAYMRFDPNIQLIPFVGIAADLKNSILNILLFTPLGFLLPILWVDFRGAKQTALLGLCTSGAIELLQMLTGRATDINDLLTNTLGVGIGWLLAFPVLKKLPVSFRRQNRKDLWLLMGCVFAVMFFPQPFLSNWLWLLFH